MKNFKLTKLNNSAIIVFAIISLFVSCTNSSEMDILDNTQYITYNCSDPLEDFNQQLNLYNQNIFNNQVFDSIQTRGFGNECLSAAAGSAADSAGGFVGKHIGKYIGGAIGSLSANPLGTFVGYIGGRYVGKYIGSVLTSAVWNIAVVKFIHSCNNSQLNYFKCAYNADFNIKVSEICVNNTNSIFSLTEKTDSLGHYHNILMNKLNNSNLLDYSNEFDFDKLYDIIRPLIEEQLNVIINIHEDKLQYDTLKAFLTKFYNEVYQHLNHKANLNEFCNRIKILIKQLYPLTEQDEYIMDSVISPTAQNLQNLSISQIHEYSKGLNNLILDSDLSDEMKTEIAYHSQILINSALIWQ